jgi:glycyl-tRNA synthetase
MTEKDAVVTEEDRKSTEQAALQDELDALNAKITSQGATVRTLKKEGGSSEAIAAGVDVLQQLKFQAAELTKKVLEISSSSSSSKNQFNRKTFDELTLRKMFIVPSFEIHGGVKGLFDLGPPACSLKVR